jgi:hypothetical protein
LCIADHAASGNTWSLIFRLVCSVNLVEFEHGVFTLVVGGFEFDGATNRYVLD